MTEEHQGRVATPRARREQIRSVDISIYQPNSQRAHRLARRTLRELPGRVIRPARVSWEEESTMSEGSGGVFLGEGRESGVVL